MWTLPTSAAGRPTSGAHIHHDLRVKGGVRLGLQWSLETCYLGSHDVHHNTLVGAGLTFSWGVFGPTSSASRFSRNIVSSGSMAPSARRSCLGSVPAEFDTQPGIGANLVETTSPRGMDAMQSGSIVTPTTALAGSGPTLALPATDPRRPALGHLYQLPPTLLDAIFADGFE